MKLLTIDSREVAGRPGALLTSGEVLDLAASPSTLAESQWIPYSIVSILIAGSGGLEHVDRLIRAAENADGAERERLRANGALLPFAGTALMAPVRRPGLLLVVGQDSATYIKSPNTAVGNRASVKVPWAASEPVMATPMLAIVIGRAIFQVDPDRAADAIVGYTLLIDLAKPSAGAGQSVTAWRRHLEGRQFPGACPMGPVIITKDEIEDLGALRAVAEINGIEMAAGTFYEQGINAGALIADLSQRYAFRPGDLVAVEPPAETGPGRPQEVSIGDLFTFRLGNLTTLDVTIT
jgi:2-keto-4-pentenoate hydratase/2-oxohepta-3-ene-1,7-dioic acid hydratase in catechol pathway